MTGNALAKVQDHLKHVPKYCCPWWPQVAKSGIERERRIATTPKREPMEKDERTMILFGRSTAKSLDGVKKRRSLPNSDDGEGDGDVKIQEAKD
jgi:hypothetical protein